jgi:membrane protease YdiL (CAAX protease family)
MMLFISKMPTSLEIRHQILATANDIWHFILKPKIYIGGKPCIGMWISIFATILFVDIVILDNAIAAIQFLFETNGYPPPTAYQVNLYDPLEWVGLLLYAPIIEELAFRGWLNGRKRNLIAFAAALPIILYEYGPIPLGRNNAIVILLVTSIICIPIWWTQQGKKPQPVPLWFERYFPWIFYCSATLFGLIHVGNFSDFEWGLDILYVLPQMAGGVMMAYTRLRLGLRAAMLHHCIFNAYFLTTEALKLV